MSESGTQNLTHPYNVVANITISSFEEVATDTKGPTSHKSTTLAILIALLCVIIVAGVIALIFWRRRHYKPNNTITEVMIPLTSVSEKVPDNISEPDSLIFKEVELHRKDETYYPTKLRYTLEEKMKADGMAVLIGPAGGGKTSISLDVASNLMNKKVKGKKCTCKILSRVGDWEDKINPRKVTILIFDSCFEKWNWMPSTVEEDLESLVRLKEEYIVSKNVFVLFTFRTYTWEKFESRLRENLDLDYECLYYLSDSGAHTENEKKNILARHFQVNNIVCCDKKEDENLKSPITLDKKTQGKMHTATFDDIIKVSEEIPKSIGFPLVCATFAYNRRLFGKGKEYFLNPCETLRREITALMKSRDEDEKQKFCTLVFAALNGGQVSTGKEGTELYTEICKAVKLKSTTAQMLDIDDDFLMETQINRFEFQHEMVLKVALFVFGEWHPEIMIRSCEADTLLRYIRTKKCDVAEIDEVLTVKREENYRLLAERFLRILENPDNDDVRNHICIKDDDKFQEKFSKRFSREFEGTAKKNPVKEKVRSSVRNSLTRMQFRQQDRL